MQPIVGTLAHTMGTLSHCNSNSLQQRIVENDSLHLSCKDRETASVSFVNPATLDTDTSYQCQHNFQGQQGKEPQRDKRETSS